MSVSSASHCEQLLAAGSTDILVSYYYIRKQNKYKTLIPLITEMGGYFMTDSGTFSFAGKYFGTEEEKLFYNPEYWIPYIEEYTEWLFNNKDYVFCAANMDLDIFVGSDVVDEWNKKYFKPLEKYMNIIYVAQKVDDERGNPPSQTKYLARLKQYLSEHDYVGINAEWRKDISKAYSLAASMKKRIHGFALTGYKDCLNYPFFSVDSTSWLMGEQYGITYAYDGTNFTQVMSKDKSKIRRSLKIKNDELSKINRNADSLKLLLKDREAKADANNRALNANNIEAWKGFRIKYLKSASLKLRTKFVEEYDKRVKM